MLQQETGYRICQLARRIHQQLAVKLQAYDVTPEQWAAVRFLQAYEGISQKELSMRMDKDQNTVKAIVDRLVGKGLLRRQRNSEDRRAFCLWLTPAGQALWQQAAAVDNQYMETVIKGISAADLQAFHALCERIRQNI